MHASATVHYHVHRPEPQAFVFDANGAVGALESPELEPRTILARNLRAGGPLPSYDEEGLTFLHAPSRVPDVGGVGPWEEAYGREIEQLLRERLGATEVVAFDHTVRVDDAAAERRPARNVHGDYSPAGAADRLVELLGETRAAHWTDDHHAFVNVWRPLVPRVEASPLGFVLPRSVDRQDVVTIDLVYPHRRGEILGLAHAQAHDWVFLDAMTRDEVAIFRTHDSHGRPWIAHSALDLVRDAESTSIRRSVESRTIIRFDGERR